MEKVWGQLEQTTPSGHNWTVRTLQAPNPNVPMKYSSSSNYLGRYFCSSCPGNIPGQAGWKGGFDSHSLQLTHPVAIRECLGSVPKSQLEGWVYLELTHNMLCVCLGWASWDGRKMLSKAGLYFGAFPAVNSKPVLVREQNLSLSN